MPNYNNNRNSEQPFKKNQQLSLFSPEPYPAKERAKKFKIDCKKCGNTAEATLTPQYKHYGRVDCDRCGMYWLKQPKNGGIVLK